MKILFVLDYETFKNNLFETAKKASPYSDYIWFRIKNQDAKLIYDLSLKLRNGFQNKFILSERADIANAVGFHGVHLNKSSISPGIIKKSFPGLNISYSAHSLSEIEKLNCDFFTLSPIFFTYKPYEVKPLGVLNVKNTGKKIFALGGINSENIFKLKGKGFYGIAGISFINQIEKIKEQNV